MASLFLAVALLLSTVTFGLTHPDLIPLKYRGGRLFHHSIQHMPRAPLGNNVTAFWYPQLVSHANPSLGIFQQRYFMDLSHLNTDTKIAMIYISGEGTARGTPTGFSAEFAKNMSAAVFTLEHRFYGESMPAPLTNKAMLFHLTVDNTLEDLFSFVNFAEDTILPGGNSSKQTYRWFIVGGSYAGALSAWLKEKYPKRFVAAWSSSGVVHSIFDFYQYDGHIVDVVGKDCTMSVQKVMSIFSAAFDSDASSMRTLFQVPDYFTKQDMLWMLADATAASVQYGDKKFLCDSVVPLSKTQPLQQYLSYIVDNFGIAFTSNCGYSTYCLSNASFSSQWVGGGYAWVWQTCNELGWWQIGYPNSMRSPTVNTDYFIQQCRATFDDLIFPDTFAFNTRHGGKRPVASSVIALQGSDDPWQTAGVDHSLGPLYPEVLAQCAGCGHCGDLSPSSSNDTAAIMNQRRQIVSYMTYWIENPNGAPPSSLESSTSHLVVDVVLGVGIPVVLLFGAAAAWFTYKRFRKDESELLLQRTL